MNHSENMSLTRYRGRKMFQQKAWVDPKAVCCVGVSTPNNAGDDYDGGGGYCTFCKNNLSSTDNDVFYERTKETGDYDHDESVMMMRRRSSSQSQNHHHYRKIGSGSNCEEDVEPTATTTHIRLIGREMRSDENDGSCTSYRNRKKMDSTRCVDDMSNSSCRRSWLPSSLIKGNELMESRLLSPWSFLFFSPPSPLFSTGTRTKSFSSSTSSSSSSSSSSSTSSSSPSPPQPRISPRTTSSLSSSVNVLVKVLFWVLVFNYHLSVLQACPIVCVCKWKGGKQTVECKNQALETLPDSIDPETQVLDISGNKLGFLPQDAFRRAGLLNLQRIHVRNSRLTQIDPGAFNELKNLVEIDLGDNHLTSVPSLALRATPFLRDLNLAGNPLRRIPRGAFEFVPQLVKLDLSRCQLVEIDPQAFAHLKLLETLKISSNELTTLNNHTVKSLAQLHSMELHDNLWDCDCRLRDLKLWIEKENIPHPVSPECRSPPRLARKKFTELSVTEFACPPRILEPTLQTPRQVRVTEGDNATFECVIDSIPSPVVRWYWYNRLIENNTLRKYIIFERDNSSVLMLTNAMKKDEGDVYCFAENAAGSAEANFTLEILPQPTLQNFLDTTQILVIILAIVAVLLVSLAVGIFLFLRQRRNRSAKPPEILATSTPVKPPRLNYEINPGSLVANGFKAKGDSTTDNPDLILETNTNGTYQETAVEDQSSNSELNWEQQSYRNMGYSTEYPPDYGLPIIHENSVYSDSSYYNVNVTPGLNGSATAVMSGVWNKNKVGARITAPSSRDSPDEGYQEGYCGTDV